MSGIRMKRLVMAAFAALLAVCVRSDVYTWDADASAEGSQDGDGAWSETVANWWDGSVNAVWTDGSDAVIGSGNGVAGTVMLSDGDVQPASLTFNAASSGVYTVDGTFLIDLNGATRTFTVNADEAVVTCGVTNGGLTKLGAGTLSLCGPDTVNSLQINGGGISAWSNLAVKASGGTFYLGNADTAYSGTLTINTGATLSVTGTLGDSGVIGRDGGQGCVIQRGGLFQWGVSGTAVYVGASSRPQTRASYAMNGGVFDMGGQVLGIGLGTATGLITGVLDQTDGVITNVGTLLVGASSQGTGLYALDGGTIFIGSGGIVSQSGKYGVALGGGTVAASAGWSSSLDMSLTNRNGSVTFDTAGNTVSLYGVLSGNGRLTKCGANGTLALTNANSFSGGTLVSAGTLSVYHNSALGSGPVTVTGGGTNKLFLNGGIAITNAVALGSEQPAYSDVLRSVSGENVIGGPFTVYQSSVRTDSGSTLRITNGIAGTSYISFNVNGTVRIETRPICLTNQTVYFGGGSSGTIRLNVGDNVFSGASLWGGVTLLLGLTDALPTNVNLYANNSSGGKLNLNGFDQTIGTLNQNVTNPLTVTNSGALSTFTVNQNANTVFAGLLSGNLKLVKKGTGTLTLTNANMFTGGAVVRGGTLRLGMADALPADGAVEVVGGNYDLGGFTVTNGAVTVSGGEIINGTLCADRIELAGTGTVRVALGGTGGLFKSGDGVSAITEALSYSGPTVIEAGTLRLQPLPAGTVAYYAFDEASDLGLDGSGLGNALETASGTPQYAENGRFGGALYLNGSSTLETLSGAFPESVPTGAAPYTVSAYIKADAGCATQGGWIGYGNKETGRGNNFRLGGSYTTVWNYWWANDFGATIPSGSFTDGWHAVVGTWDGATERLFIDGVQCASRTPSAPDVGTNLFAVGKTIGDANFKGWVDDLLIANRALSLNEIQTLVSEGGYRPCALPSGTLLSVASGATLDLNGNAQSVATLAGEGCVTGGVLTVSGLLSPGDAAGAVGTLSVAGGLTLSAGVTHVFDCSTAASDTVRVTGTLTLAGPATLRLVISEKISSLLRADLFTYDALVNGQTLSDWTVEGVPNGYSARLTASATAITLTVSRMGTLCVVR